MRGFAVAQRLAAGIDDRAAGGFEHGVARCRVPFHGLAKAWVNVGSPTGNFEEFDGRPGARAVLYIETRQERFGLRIEMGQADQRGQAFLRRDPDAQSGLRQVGKFSTRLVWSKLGFDRFANPKLAKR